MKNVSALVVVLVAVSSVAYASPSRNKFTCNFQEGSLDVMMQFVAVGMETVKGLHVETFKNNNGDDQTLVLHYRKKGTTKWTKVHTYDGKLLVSALDGGDATDLYYTKDRTGQVMLARDASDTCTDVDFRLYQNTRYSAGYIRSLNMCDDSSKGLYSKVACKIQKL